MKKSNTYLLLVITIIMHTKTLIGMFASLSCGSKLFCKDTIFNKPIHLPLLVKKNHMPCCEKCLEEFNIGEIVARTVCSHKFHTSCITQTQQDIGYCLKCFTYHNDNEIINITIESLDKRSTKYGRWKVLYYETSNRNITIVHLDDPSKTRKIRAKNKNIDTVIITEENNLYILYQDRQIDQYNIQKRTSSVLFESLDAETSVLIEQE